MESSSDMENSEQGECSSGSEFADNRSKLYTESELLSNSQENADKAIVNVSSSN